MKPFLGDTSQVVEAVILPQKGGQESAVPDLGNITKADAKISVLKNIASFKKLQKTVEKKVFHLDKAIISQQTNPNNNNIYNTGAGDKNTKSDFIFDLLKRRITNLENEISKNDAIIGHLTIQLFTSKIISHNHKKNLQEDDDNDYTNKNRTSRGKTGAQGNKGRNTKRKVVVTGNSLNKGINERGLSKDQLGKIHIFSGSTCETIIKEIDILVFDKRDSIIIQGITKDITNGITSLTVFSSLITRRDKRDLDKNVQDVNHRSTNYCAQTNIDYMENSNIKEDHLGNKKLHLNKRGNTVIANDLC